MGTGTWTLVNLQWQKGAKKKREGGSTAGLADMLDCSGELAYRQKRASEDCVVNCGRPPIAYDDMRVPRLPCSLLQEAGRIKQKRDVVGARQQWELTGQWRDGGSSLAAVATRLC